CHHAAAARALVRIAGARAGGTITWMAGPKTVANHIVPRITKSAKEAGRPDPRVVVGLPVAVTDDPAGARERAARSFQIYGTLPNYHQMLNNEGAAGAAAVAVVGNEAEVQSPQRQLPSAAPNCV